MRSTFTNNETINFHEKIESDNITWGLVDKVDTQKQVMQVLIPSNANAKPQVINVPIGNSVTNYGSGFRMMPFSGGKTAVYVFEDTGGKYHHMGYVLDNIEKITDNLTGDAQENSSTVLIRHLEEGEIQMSGAFGNEFFLSIDGSATIKTQFGSYLKIDNYMSRLDGNFANLKYEMDGVRLRMGNVIRPTRTDTTEDQFIIKDGTGTIKGSDKLSDTDTWTPLKEFTVQVGTLQDSANKYTDYLNPYLSPTVGTFSMSDTFIKEDGTGLYSGGSPVKCYLRMASGGGFMVTEDGSFAIMDYVNWSSIKFPAESPERSMRLRGSIISVAESSDDESKFKTEILMNHESGAQIEVREGYIQLTEATGRYVKLDNFGLAITVPDASVSINAKDIQLSVDGGCVSIGGMPTDGVLKATQTSLMFDTHTHAGPVGPPLSTFQWTPFLQVPNSPFVAQSFKVG